MKAYKIEILVLDFDELGVDEVRETLENANYPNDCISPHVMQVTVADIGKWTDEHPLNSSVTQEAEYRRLFDDEKVQHPGTAD